MIQAVLLVALLLASIVAPPALAVTLSIYSCPPPIGAQPVTGCTLQRRAPGYQDHALCETTVRDRHADGTWERMAQAFLVPPGYVLRFDCTPLLEFVVPGPTASPTP